jgi:hypothetical protein
MRLAASLKPAELRNLHRAVRAVLLEAIRLRGSSISDYVDSDGQPPRLPTHRQKVFPLRNKNTPRHRSRPQQPLLSPLPTRPSPSPPAPSLKQRHSERIVPCIWFLREAPEHAVEEPLFSEVQSP